MCFIPDRVGNVLVNALHSNFSGKFRDYEPRIRNRVRNFPKGGFQSDPLLLRDKRGAQFTPKLLVVGGVSEFIR
jgi:hypothetical protein